MNFNLSISIWDLNRGFWLLIFLSYLKMVHKIDLLGLLAVSGLSTIREVLCKVYMTRYIPWNQDFREHADTDLTLEICWPNNSLSHKLRATFGLYYNTELQNFPRVFFCEISIISLSFIISEVSQQDVVFYVESFTFFLSGPLDISEVCVSVANKVFFKMIMHALALYHIPYYRKFLTQSRLAYVWARFIFVRWKKEKPCSYFDASILPMKAMAYGPIV